VLRDSSFLKKIKMLHESLGRRIEHMSDEFKPYLKGFRTIKLNPAHLLFSVEDTWYLE
jgi:hypothetical protein